MMERGFYTTYSRIRSIDGHGSGSRKKSPPNKQFIPHHLSRGKNRTMYKKTREILFFSSCESQNYIFSVWFVGVFFAVASDGENSRGYECYAVEIAKTVKYAK